MDTPTALTWPFDQLGWWIYAIHRVCSQHPIRDLDHQVATLGFSEDGCFLPAYQSWYEATLALLKRGSLEPADAKRLLFRAKSLRKWRLAPAHLASVRRDKALDGFIARDEAANSAGLVPYPYCVRMREVLASWLPEIEGSGFECTGRFGPGAVAERWTHVQRLERLSKWIRFSPGGAFISGHSPGRTWPDIPPEWIEDAEHLTARLHAVPKDYSKDRLISIEPAYSTFAQAYARESIQVSIHLGPLKGTCMDLGWTDGQEIQRRLALSASRTGCYATLDLSDASDGITWEMVQQVFPNWVLRLLDSSRTPYYVDPRSPSKTRTMRIYAGMGNGTTFTVETLFFAAFVAAYAYCHGLPRWVSVFGDDIICKTETAQRLLAENFAFFRINRQKSFLGDDALRESCGIFAYRGVDITVPKVDGYRPGWAGRLALCDLHHRLVGSGDLWQRRLALTIAEEGLLVNWPFVVPGYPSIDDDLTERSLQPPTRWNHKLQCREAYLPVIRQRYRHFPTDWSYARKRNDPSPLVWLDGSLLGMFGNGPWSPFGESKFSITGRGSRRRWSWRVPDGDATEISLRWRAVCKDGTPKGYTGIPVRWAAPDRGLARSEP